MIKYEKTRDLVQKFISARYREEIIFVRGATEAINLVSHSYALKNLKEGDEILISEMEHHANIVPWQLVCEQTGAILKVAPITDDGVIDQQVFNEMLSEKVKMVSFAHVSNVLGTVNPVKEMIAKIRERTKAKVLIDGAQATSHVQVDVTELDCDFYVFSGHKMYAPTGIGVLYGKKELLQSMPPYQGGGDMIRTVSFEKTEFNVLPFKFEAGTPNIAGVIGLYHAILYLQQWPLAEIAEYEHRLLESATKKMQNIPGLRILGPKDCSKKSAVISFVLDGVHPHDIGTILDHYGVAARAGHHCAMPLMARLKIPASARVSFGLYNNEDDINKLITALSHVVKMFGGVQ